MRFRGQGLKVLAGKGGVRYGEEGCIPFGLLGKVTVAEDLRRLREGGGCGNGEQQRETMQG